MDDHEASDLSMSPTENHQVLAEVLVDQPRTDRPDIAAVADLPGLYRLIDLRKVDARTAVGWVEDDFHHFGVTVRHEAGRITGISMVAERYPWATCPGAAEPLQALVGCAVVERASDIGGLINMRLQCTHVFDLTGLVLAHIFAGREHRRYIVRVSDREKLPGFNLENKLVGPGHAWLLQDGEPVMHWELYGFTVVGPDLHHPQSLETGFRAWTESLPTQAAEHAFILRRGILVGGGRMLRHDDYANADAMGVPALCHSFQSAQRVQAIRMMGATRDPNLCDLGMLTRVNDVP
jgi:Protein of unknown function (DUF2889)